MYVTFLPERDEEWYWRFNDDSYYLIGWVHEDTADGDTEEGERIAPIFSECGNLPTTKWKISVLVGAPIESHDNKKDRKRIKKCVHDAMKPFKSYPVETLWDEIAYYYFYVDKQPHSPFFYSGYGEY